MVAPRGVRAFSSEESRAAERAASIIVVEEVSRRPDFSLVATLSYADLLGVEPTYAVTNGGVPTGLEPDPGFIRYRGRIAAIPEVKYQFEPKNAVERCFRWMAVAALPTVGLPLNRLFFAFYGDAFLQNAGRKIPGQGGGVVELCTHLPIRLVVNATSEEFRAEFVALLDDIVAGR